MYTINKLEAAWDKCKSPFPHHMISVHHHRVAVILEHHHIYTNPGLWHLESMWRFSIASYYRFHEVINAKDGANHAKNTWWRHDMEPFPYYWPCEGNTGHGGIPPQGDTNAKLWCFYASLFSEESNRRWFETPWRTCDANMTDRKFQNLNVLNILVIFVCNCIIVVTCVHSDIAPKNHI